MGRLKRKYALNDACMLDVSASLHQVFMKNIADFESFDANLNMNFANLWLAKIKEAYSNCQNTQLKDIQIQKRDEVNDLLLQCKAKYHEVNFFANKAFAPNDKHREVFGSITFNQSKRTTSRMIAFLDELYAASNTYKNELMASGMSLIEIEAIATLKDLLLNKYTESQNFKKVKKEITKQRVVLLNSCYAMTRLVIDAAFIIYKNDYARKKMFVFNAA